MTSATIPGSCGSCGVGDCRFNVEAALSGVALDGEAWLLDEVWPEFVAYLQASHAVAPTVFLPWSNRWKKQPAYAWPLPAQSVIKSAPLLTLRRSLAMRGLALQGARRQQVLEDFDARFARAYAARLPHLINRLVVWQNFLPFLHLDKTLGGRCYDVLLWRAPREVLHRTLNEAKRRFPESRTLDDFRSDPHLAATESRALAGAKRILTPHHQLARLYPDKTIVIPWHQPQATAKSPTSARRIAFLGPTLGRRGAYVARAAAREFGVPLVVIGRNLEAPDFWNGVEIEERSHGPAWLKAIGLLLAPALTEYKPRRILEALAEGVRVIATESCGLPVAENLTLIDPYDTEALARAMEAFLLGNETRETAGLAGN